MKERQPAVYMLASGRHGTLYIGVTSDLPARVHQHREGLIKGFTSRYGIARLVWFEAHATMDAAILREKQLKKWNRGWKTGLVEERNPYWDDLAVTVLGFEPLADILPRHSRASGNPRSRDNESDVPTSMDSRLRGNDGGCFERVGS